MEQINRIEIAGTVGYVRRYSVGEGELVRFSVMVDEANNGVEWFTCSATSEKKGEYSIEKGQHVRVEGRLRRVEYVDQDCNERSYYEVIVRRVSK